ncbi:MAG TPA: S-adenosylmethionine:tRNA ribosyltransferase-isomerase [Jatrophihabitantaceae bacterium]|jgi:S-adenosylmethionine:tRNA ribosyltransferase-isomerase
MIFDLPDELSAGEPPEQRGLARDQVRLLVARSGGTDHAHFADLAGFLAPGDLVVVNTSATLAAAVEGTRSDGREVSVHFSTALDDGTWLVEVRPRIDATAPVPDAVAGERIELAIGVGLTLLAPHRGSDRLWSADVAVEGDVETYLARYGRPITYSYVRDRPPIDAYQTVFARDPGSAEMPSAGRPFTAELVTSLVSAGVGVAPITLHTGVSSLEEGEPPLRERYRVPASTARLVNLTRASGGRIVAVGTTVTRALETVAHVDGWVAGGSGWTDLVLGPQRPARVVDGLITGWHAPGASHLLLLESVAGADLVASAYQEALVERYLWHEFGDSCLLLPERRRLGVQRAAA